MVANTIMVAAALIASQQAHTCCARTRRSDGQLSGVVSPGGVSGGDLLSVTMQDPSDEAVYAACSSELVRFAAGLVGPDDAPDVVVEAFLRVARSSVWARARDKRALTVVSGCGVRGEIVESVDGSAPGS